MFPVLRSGIPDTLGLIVPLTGVGLTVIYFVQKQKLQELQLFEKLFTQFNARYEQLNDRLEDLLAGKIEGDLAARKVLDDYFNLCSEEYLFYSEGRIHPTAWKAWCRGMLRFLGDERVRKYWQEQAQLGSHYGLTVSIIQQGAGEPGTAVSRPRDGGTISSKASPARAG